jgi:hypothetical protein
MTGPAGGGPVLGNDQDAHRLREGRDLHGLLAVVSVPSCEQFDDLTAVRIVGFDDVLRRKIQIFASATTAREWVLLPARDCRFGQASTKKKAWQSGADAGSG